MAAPDAISAPMVAALESAWAAIRDRNPSVPPVVMILGAGSAGAPPGMLKLGHFAPIRWRDGDADEPFGEIFVGGEGLRRGPADVLGTLLHEAAHAVAHVRGVRDTSRQGRYHNDRYRQLAVELGIAVTRSPLLGWSDTTVPDETREEYWETLAELGEVLTWWRAAEGTIQLPIGGDPGEPQPPTAGGKTPTAGGRPSSNNAIPCLCGCSRRIRVAPSILALGPITCGLCKSEFVPLGE